MSNLEILSAWEETQNGLHEAQALMSLFADAYMNLDHAKLLQKLATKEGCAAMAYCFFACDRFISHVCDENDKRFALAWSNVTADN